jgi:YD repeat-containing protein
MVERHTARTQHRTVHLHIYDYAYDGADRLTSAQYPTALGLLASENFAYDPAGNREDPTDPNA